MQVTVSRSQYKKKNNLTIYQLPNIISKDLVETGVNNTSHPENFMELI